jgi:hypothetical protein
MLTNNELIASNNARLIAQRNQDNQQWMDLLIELELTQTHVLESYLSCFNYCLSDHSSWSDHYAGSAEPEFIELLKALIQLKKSHPETSNTVLSDLINDLITDSVQLASEIIPKSMHHFRGTRKGNLIKLTDTVNNVTTLIQAIRRDADTKDAIETLVKSADDLYYSLTGPLYRRSLVVAGLIGVTICLVGVALLSSPFLLASLIMTAPAASGIWVAGLLTTCFTGCFGGILSMTLGYMHLEDTCANAGPNYYANKTKESAKKFTQNTQTLFSPKSKAIMTVVQMCEITPANRVA